MSKGRELIGFLFFILCFGISDFIGNLKHTQKLPIKKIQSLTTQIDVLKCFFGGFRELCFHRYSVYIIKVILNVLFMRGEKSIG